MKSSRRCSEEKQWRGRRAWLEETEDLHQEEDHHQEVQDQIEDHHQAWEDQAAQDIQEVQVAQAQTMDHHQATLATHNKEAHHQVTQAIQATKVTQACPQTDLPQATCSATTLILWVESDQILSIRFHLIKTKL